MKGPPDDTTPPAEESSASVFEETGPTREARLSALRSENLLVDLALRAEMDRSDSPLYTDPHIVAWLDAEVNSPERSGEGWPADRVHRAAARVRAKVEARRLRMRAIAGPPALRTPPILGTIPQVIDKAVASSAVPYLELSAAAGVGRDLWDEVCDSWVELPEDVPPGRHIAIRVTGESMIPLMHTGDTLLVRLDTEVVRNTVVLARLPDAGYVVKRVQRVTTSQLELASLNPDFPTISVVRDEQTVIGTVILLWCPHERVRSPST